MIRLLGLRVTELDDELDATDLTARVPLTSFNNPLEATWDHLDTVWLSRHPSDMIMVQTS